jgi:glycerophosphoryl diester phosphodiesterase
MKYKKSHMDQKVRPYVTKAIENGCNILEVDIQSACGVIVCGHDWRPKLPFLFDCTLEDYLKRVPAGTIVQLDVKEICFTYNSRVKFGRRVTDITSRYPHINFLISANNGLSRTRLLYYILHNEWIRWKTDKDIETVDLW